eukprot:gene5285-3790_t
MPLGYKSETGAVLLTAAAVISLPLMPWKAVAIAIPVWMVASRMVARGARCRVRPPNVLSSEAALSKAPFVFSATMQREKRPVCVVTGTNSGIGFHTAAGLAAEGYEVVITCRSASLTGEVARQIAEEAKKLRRSNIKKFANAPQEILVVGEKPIESDNFESIRTFAKWFKETYEQRNVQVLVNNAGMMRKELKFSTFQPTLELHTAVNFLGPLLLTELLLPELERNAGRVVYVSSEAHRFPQSTLEAGMFGLWKKSDHKTGSSLINGKLLSALRMLNQGQLKCSGPLCVQDTKKAFVRYGTSKLLNTYHAHHIAKRYQNAPETRRVRACSLHPGCVVTGFQRDLVRSRFLDAVFNVGGLLYLKTSEEGAQTSLHCAMCPAEELELVRPSNSASPDLAVSPYFVECAEKTRSMLLGYGWDLEEAESIVSWGKELVGLIGH